MSSAAQSYDLPKTAQSAPPNFYSQAGTGAGGAGTPDDKAGASGDGQSADEAHSEFVQNVAKLLTVLQKMGKSKPNGVDISKYTKACSQVLKDCLEQVSTGGSAVPGGSAPGAEEGSPPADVGSTGPPAAAAAGGGGSPSAGAAGQ